MPRQLPRSARYPVAEGHIHMELCKDPPVESAGHREARPAARRPVQVGRRRPDREGEPVAEVALDCCVGRLEYPFVAVAILTLRALAVDSGCALLACGACLACYS